MDLGYLELRAIGDIASAERLLNEAMERVGYVATNNLLTSEAMEAAQAVWERIHDMRTESLPEVARRIVGEDH